MRNLKLLMFASSALAMGGATVIVPSTSVTRSLYKYHACLPTGSLPLRRERLPFTGGTAYRKRYKKYLRLKCGGGKKRSNMLHHSRMLRRKHRRAAK